jgi:hypothetical protein
VFVHGVTSAAALRSLVPFLDAATTRELIRHGWQAGAALYAAFASAKPFEGALAAAGPSAESLIDGAIAHGDDHAIKFVEACLREHAFAPDPVFPSAAAHALAALPKPRR